MPRINRGATTGVHLSRPASFVMAQSTSSSIGNAQSGWPPGAHLGRYELLAKVAAGGMAEVYVGRVPSELGFSRLLALKVLHQNLVHEGQFISMFLDEARLAARIRHPNVVSTVDVGRADDDGAPFLVMEYIEGDHFGQLLGAAGKRGEKVPLPVTLRIVCDALAGLSAAHALRDERGKWLKLVHRDVSPQNIIVGCDGVARLSDFGIAKAEDRLTHTREGQVKGKLAYMAPEQASSGTTDARSDLFAMGIILWEAVVGRRLFRGQHAGSLLNKILNEDAPLPSTLDATLSPLDNVLAQALHRDPEQRFQDADAFHDALEEAAAAFAGLASRRQVGATVRLLAAAKLERDRQLISSVSGPQVLTPGARPRPSAADVRAHLGVLEPATSTTQVSSPAARRRKSSGKRPTAAQALALECTEESGDVDAAQVEPNTDSLVVRTGDKSAPQGRPSSTASATQPSAPISPRVPPTPSATVPPLPAWVDAPLQPPPAFHFGKRATVLFLGLLAFLALLIVGQNEEDSDRRTPPDGTLAHSPAAHTGSPQEDARQPTVLGTSETTADEPTVLAPPPPVEVQSAAVSPPSQHGHRRPITVESGSSIAEKKIKAAAKPIPPTAIVPKKRQVATAPAPAAAPAVAADPTAHPSPLLQAKTAPSAASPLHIADDDDMLDNPYVD